MASSISFEAAKPNKKVFDFRSDTVTKPTQQMLQSMISVEVGDDVKDDDPTVHALQKQIAELCGKESALFVCSGVMANQLAIRTHVTDCYSREVVLQEVIADYRSHVYKYELGGIAFHSGAQVQALHPPDNKMLTAEFIEKHIHSANNLHYPLTTIISLENTLNGTVFSLEEIWKIRALADKFKLKLHCDGARLWHASVATGLSLKDLAEPFDSISMCFSKGLGTPIGSVLVGNTQFINRARQYRKVFGGGWRQAGYLAAACLYALDNHWTRLKDDHLNCKLLHQEVTKLGFKADSPDTNMIFVDVTPLNTNWQTIVEKVNQLQTSAEVKVLLEGEGPVGRLVVHMQTPKEAIDRLVELLSQVVAQLQQK